MRKCSVCKLTKNYGEFHKKKGGYMGLDSARKICVHEEYMNTKGNIDVMIGMIYNKQRASSRRRGHSMPEYSKAELKKYMMSNPKFRPMYKKWINSNMLSKLRPSIDRLDVAKGYSFSNIRLVTWDENMKADHAYRSEPIYRLDRFENKILKKYKSAMDCVRQHNVTSGNMTSILNINNGKQFDNSIWMRVKDYNNESYLNKQKLVNRFFISIVTGIDNRVIKISNFENMDTALSYVLEHGYQNIKNGHSLYQKIISPDEINIFKTNELCIYFKKICSLIKNNEIKEGVLNETINFTISRM